MANHPNPSPAPWTWDGTGIRDARGYRIASCRWASTGGQISMRIKTEEHAANARLMVAAPALLTWIESVATDSQLDAPVPRLDGQTGRDVLKKLQIKPPQEGP